VRAPFAIFAATILGVAACGARSQLRIDETRERADAGADAPADAGPDVVDAPEDAPPDVFDAPPDVIEEPPPDECADAGTTYIYLITSENELARFYPPEGQVHIIGPISCPVTDPQDAPFSMAVDRAGTAYVLFNQGDLFRVNTGTAACQATTFQKDQNGFHTFGMGYSANVADAGETLYIASDFGGGVDPERLGVLDTTLMVPTEVGQFDQMIGNAELTGSGDGHLYGFGIENINGQSFVHLAEIDKQTAGIIDDAFITLPSGNEQIDGWAFAFWGGDFYFFTSTQSMVQQSNIARYHPGDPPMATLVTTFGGTIVGAGVSTCAPQQ
jgi:hypothetical protein